MSIPEDRFYSDFHLWVSMDGLRATIGLTEYALEELGEIDFIQLPEPGESVAKDRPFGLVETSKAVTDLVSPLSGTVAESNQAVQESPPLLMEDPYLSGWLIVVNASDQREIAQMLKAAAYAQVVEGGTDQPRSRDAT
ncbi:MAG: glycine cleavage system protein GcvH [Desulfomonile tiedjei]|nr:glycine cleavage system protein GcvH [Desulfomonile tiedjei]